MTTDTSEKGLETLIMLHMTGTHGLTSVPDWMAAETPDFLAAAKAAGSGWLAGNPKDYDRTHALDVPQLFQFLQTTQPEAFKKIGMADYKDTKDIARLKFFARLSSEIGKRGVIDVLRKGLDHGPLHFDLFYGTPSPGNATAALLASFATYAAGFLVRPFGALVFGRIGDLVGRKYTFLVTILVMGLSTAAAGLLQHGRNPPGTGLVPVH